MTGIVTRDEFMVALKAKRDTESGQRRMRELQAEVHEAVRSSALTRNEHWDGFLAKIEARIQATETCIANERNLQNAFVVMDHEKLRLSAIKVACWQTRLETLQEILALPRQAIEAGEAASTTLRAMQVPEPQE